MAQLLRVQNFIVSSDGFGAGEDQSLERPFGHADPGELFAVGRRHGELAQPHRPRRQPRPRRLLHPRLRQQHRRRDHGPQQVRPAARPVAGPRVAGLVGRRAAVPHPGVRPDPPRAAVVHACRTPRSTSSTATRPTVLEQAREAADGKDVRLGGGVDHHPAVPRRRPRRHHARRGLRRWSSAPERGSGSRPTSCSTGSTSRSCRARAA